MSFVGAVAASVRQVLANYAREVDRPVLICGAGNFTVPSVLRSGGYTGPIKSCDVSLYTTALGYFLTGQALDVREREDCPDHLRGLFRAGSPVDVCASVSLLLDLRECWQRKNPYQVRWFDTLVGQWDELLGKTRKKLAAYKKHIDPVEYTAEDGFVFLERHDPAHTVFAFPPTYKRGYEKLEKLFGEILEWTPPEYREMTDKSLDLYEQVARFDAYFVVLEKDLPDVCDILGEPVAVLSRGRGAKSYILARSVSRKIVIRQTAKSGDIGPVWPPDKEVTGKEVLSVARLSLAQTIRLNELFLSKRIDYFTGGVGLSLAFLLDGRVFGKADFCPSAHQWKLPEVRPMIYLMSDLAVPSVEKRLSKLALTCILSSEVKDLVDLRWVERFAWVITTAFSPHPVSMKYRGLFTLHKRKPEPGGHMLNYYARMGAHTLKKGFAAWIKKYHK